MKTRNDRQPHRHSYNRKNRIHHLSIIRIDEKVGEQV
jgi:hypothetical protein